MGSSRAAPAHHLAGKLSIEIVAVRIQRAMKYLVV
jgi:hypothetical protein